MVPPERLAGYGNINESFPERIMSMAESEMKCRHVMEEKPFCKY
ncbi:MAG: DUF2335 domain-containing protein [Deltaproteobacteria bacterium]|nr:DUF2335 domain-containing protein [Deltaproteobacteria bacterium]